VFVTGRVQRPGEYLYKDGLTAGVVIEEAGGRRKDYDNGLPLLIYISRRVDGKDTRCPATAATVVQPGDVLQLTDLMLPIKNCSPKPH
jgi:hypothetical protein